MAGIAKLAKRTAIAIAGFALALSFISCSPTSAPAGEEPADISRSTDLAALAEKAEAEGTLAVYGDASDATLKSWTDAFSAEYGISVTVVRNATGPLYQQFAREASAGQDQADVISLLDHIALDEAVGNDWIAQYTPQEAKALPAQYAREGFYYSSQNVTSPVIAYNTERVSADELKRLKADPIEFLAEQDLSDRVGVVAPQAGQQLQAFWYLYSDGPAADDFGWSTLEGIAANTSRISDTVAIGQAVVQGEIDFGLPLADSYIVSLITATGAPLGFVYPDPSVVVTSALAITQNAPHPYAARLFAEWAASKAGVTAWSKAANNQPMRDDIDDPRTYLKESWFTQRPEDVWTDFESDQNFLDVMDPDGSYFPTWNGTFGYSG